MKINLNPQEMTIKLDRYFEPTDNIRQFTENIITSYSQNIKQRTQSINQSDEEDKVEVVVRDDEPEEEDSNLKYYFMQGIIMSIGCFNLIHLKALNESGIKYYPLIGASSIIYSLLITNLIDVITHKEIMTFDKPIRERLEKYNTGTQIAIISLSFIYTTLFASGFYKEDLLIISSRGFVILLTLVIGAKSIKSCFDYKFVMDNYEEMLVLDDHN